MENYDLKNVESDDFGLLYGFSLFETFLVNEDYKVFLLDKHLDRLFNSLEFFDVEIEKNKHELAELILLYIKENNLAKKVIRLTITAGNEAQNLKPRILLSNRNNTYTKKAYIDGFNIQTIETGRNGHSFIIKHKTANYLENLILWQKSKSKGFHDCLMLNSNDYITETTRSNIFFVRNNCLFTPSEGCGLLKGIIRNYIFELAKILDRDVIEGEFKISDLKEASEIFLTNSIMGIMPVKSINLDKMILEKDNKITQKLALLYEEKVKNDNC